MDHFHDHGKPPFIHRDIGKAHHRNTHHVNVHVLSKPMRSDSHIQLNNGLLTSLQRSSKKSQNTSRPTTHSEFSASTPTLNKIDHNDMRPSVFFSNPRSHIDVNYPTSLMKRSLEDTLHVCEHVPVPVQIPTIPTASCQVVKSSTLANISSHSTEVSNSTSDTFPPQYQYGVANYHSKSGPASAVPVNVNMSPQPMTEEKCRENPSRKWSNTGTQSLANPALSPKSWSNANSSMRAIPSFTVNLPSRKWSSVSSEEKVYIDEFDDEIDSPFMSAAFDDAPSKSATEPLQLTKLKSYPKLLSTFIANSPTLPCKVRIIKGTLYPSNGVAISSGHDLEIHFIKHSKAFSVQDPSGNVFAIPFNSSIKVSVMYNPSNPVKFVQCHKEFKFRSASDIMKLKTIPLVVAATKAYTGETIKSSVNERQILVIKGIRTKDTKGYQLMAKTLSGAKKLLSAECIGHFSTAPNLICMSLKEFLKCKITLPQRVVLNYPASSQKIKNLPSVVTVMERINGSSIISTCPSLANESKVLEIPFSSSLVVQEIENAKTTYTTECLYESFDACTVAHCSESPKRVCHDIQNTFYKCLSSTHRSLGWEISNPEAINTKQHPIKFKNADLTQERLPQADTPIYVKSRSKDYTEMCNPSVLNSSSKIELQVQKAEVREDDQKKGVPLSPFKSIASDAYMKMKDNEDFWANNTMMEIPEMNNHDGDVAMNTVVRNMERRSTHITPKKSEHTRNQEGSLNVSNRTANGANRSADERKHTAGYFGTRLSKAKTRIGQFLNTGSRIVTSNSPKLRLTATHEFNPAEVAQLSPTCKQTMLLAATAATGSDTAEKTCTSPVPSMPFPFKAQKTSTVNDLVCRQVSKVDVGAINNSPEDYCHYSKLKDVVDSNDHHTPCTIAISTTSVIPATTTKVPTRDQHQKPPLAPKPKNYIKAKQATPNLVLCSTLQPKNSKPVNQDLSTNPSTHRENIKTTRNESSSETEDLDAIVDSIANWCLQIEDEVNQLSNGLLN